jgi:DNA-binding CsgD family transcriptional regulator/PAS domain-containing protein
MIVEQLTELIDLIYASALRTDAWPQALDGLRRQLGCESAAMLIYDIDHGRLIMSIHAGAYAVSAKTYERHFSASEAHFDKLKIYDAEEYMIVFNGHEAPRWPALAARREEIVKSDSHDISGFMFKVADSIVHIAIRCSQKRQCCDFSEILELLAPHLQRAMLVSRQRSELEQRLESMESVLSHFRSGVILIDERGRAAFLNRRARELVKARNGLKVVDGQLVGSVAVTTRDLRSLLSRAIEQGRNGGSSIGAMTIKHSNDTKVNLSMVAVPLHPKIHALSHKPAIYAALLIGSSAFASALNPDVLKLLYKLTGAEARLAIGLALGKTLEKYAQESGIQPATVRGYLKQVFQKTSTNRQTELVNLLHSIPFYLKE